MRVQPHTQQCTQCNTYRDTIELFMRGDEVCLLCERRAERKNEGLLHKSQRQVDHAKSVAPSPEEIYRHQLINSGAGYTDSQIEMHIDRKFST